MPFARLSVACFLVRCRARVLRADRAGAPSTPGGLGVFIEMRGSLGMVADIKLFRKLDQRAICILSCSFF